MNEEPVVDDNKAVTDAISDIQDTEQETSELLEEVQQLKEEIQKQNDLQVTETLEIDSDTIDTNVVISEGFFMVTITIIVCFAVNILISQMTKW